MREKAKIIYQKVEQCADCPCLRWNFFNNVKKKARATLKELRVNPYCFLKTCPGDHAYTIDKAERILQGKIEESELRAFPQWCPLQDFEEPHEIKEINGKTIWEIVDEQVE